MMVKAKKLVEDSLVVNPADVWAAIDGPPLRSVMASGSHHEVCDKDNDDHFRRTGGSSAPQSNFKGMTSEEMKSRKAARKELEESKKKEVSGDFGKGASKANMCPKLSYFN